MNTEIPIFFAADDNYIPCLAVAIQSLKDNANNNTLYKLIILHSDMSENKINEVMSFGTDNIKIELKNIAPTISKLEKDLDLRLRDYYSSAIYYRMFIPSLYPEYDKAIYLDSDIVLLDDIKNFYQTDLGTNLVGAIVDSVVKYTPVFHEYVLKNLGVEYTKYFNSGVLLMNLKEMRNSHIEDKFIKILTKYNCDSIAPDQDYLNVLCKDKVTYLPVTWDKMPDFGDYIDEKDLHLIHYNMFRKPWHYSDVPYSDIFWKYAKETNYYDILQKDLDSYTDEQKKNDLDGASLMQENSQRIISLPDGKFIDIIDTID